MGFPPLKIEILNYLEGSDFEEAYSKRKLVKLDDLEISLINIDDLILNKKAVGRLQDLADVEQLERLR
ncbi:MAG TPA: hypothetical protein PKC65_15040 [Pyrinomonadaceae bacterium]|nr:hypothetical protein [Pyrinomonadaceae bacterium]